MPHTLGQERAAFSLQELRNALQGPGDAKKKLRDEFPSFSAGLPAMILQNGFGQTLAFLLAKATDSNGHRFKRDDKQYVAYSIITSWLRRQGHLQGDGEADVIAYISREMTQADYLQAQRETLALLEWVKRFANAALFDEGGA